MPSARSINAVTIEDLRRAAQRRLPRVVFDYIDGGADGEITLRENSRAFERIVLRPRNAVAGGPCGMATTVLGERLELPFLLAPVGSSRLFYPRGECVAAAQAGAAGTAYVLSTLSGCRLEEVARRVERTAVVSSSISSAGARSRKRRSRAPRRRGFRRSC